MKQLDAVQVGSKIRIMTTKQSTPLEGHVYAYDTTTGYLVLQTLSKTPRQPHQNQRYDFTFINTDHIIGAKIVQQEPNAEMVIETKSVDVLNKDKLQMREKQAIKLIESQLKKSTTTS